MKHGQTGWIWVLGLAVAGLFVGGCGSGTPGQRMADMIGSIMPESPLKAAQDAFNAYDPDVRCRALQKLAAASWGGEEPYLRTYRLLVDDPDPTVRGAAIAALGKHGTPEDVDRVLPYLEFDADNKIVRWEAAKALQRLHREDAVGPLSKAMTSDRDADVRMACANALGQYHTRPVFQSLVGALNDRDFGVVQEARQSLGVLTGKDLGNDGRVWLDWAKERDDLFANAGTYYYPQFEKPRTWVDKVQVWKEPETVEPLEPRS